MGGNTIIWKYKLEILQSMKKLISFNFSFKDFTGEVMKAYNQNNEEVPGGLPAWKELGITLSMTATKDGNTAVKYFGLAQQLGTKHELELDKADTDMLKEFIGAVNMRSDFKAQLLDAIDNAKEV